MKDYTLAKKLKAIRENCDKTQEQIAKKLDVSRITVQNYENATTTPSIDILREYCKLGKVSWSYLLDHENDSTENELVSLVMLLPADAQNKLLEFLKSLTSQ